MTMSSVLQLPIEKVSKLLGKGAITSLDLCSMCLERANLIRELNAFITLCPEYAHQQAHLSHKRITTGKSFGTLDGIPMAFKDNISTKHIRTTCGSKVLSNYIPPYNATVVQRLVDKGAVMIGKTNLDEFAMGSATVDSYYGPTKNPWKSHLKYKSAHQEQSFSYDGDTVTRCNKGQNGDFYVCGGSSGGGAVAVATGTCFGAIGSDTGGSIRSPAALCGIVGLKPTYGLISRSGLIPLCNPLDVPGILTRTVDDAALLLNYLAGYDNADSTTINRKFELLSVPEFKPREFHVGIPKEYDCHGLSSEISEMWKTIADMFEKAGAKVSSVSLPHTQYSIVCYSVLCACEVASNFARYDGVRYGHRASADVTSEHHYSLTRKEGLGDVVRDRIIAGNYFLLKKNYEKYYLKASKVQRLICKDFKAVFDSGINFLLTPVALNTAVPYSDWKLIDNREHNVIDDFCTQPANMAGLPAISIPCSLSQNGLPISLQLIGQQLDEKLILSAAKWLEEQLNFPLLDIHA